MSLLSNSGMPDFGGSEKADQNSHITVKDKSKIANYIMHVTELKLDYRSTILPLCEP